MSPSQPVDMSCELLAFRTSGLSEGHEDAKTRFVRRITAAVAAATVGAKAAPPTGVLLGQRLPAIRALISVGCHSNAREMKKAASRHALYDRTRYPLSRACWPKKKLAPQATGPVIDHIERNA